MHLLHLKSISLKLWEELWRQGTYSPTHFWCIRAQKSLKLKMRKKKYKKYFQDSEKKTHAYFQTILKAPVNVWKGSTLNCGGS